MRVSYLWLKSLVDFSLSPQELAEVLTMTGLEVESLEPVGPKLDGVRIAKVLEVNPHPNADKLSLCTVDTGGQTQEVVCGAPNVQAGQIVPFVGVGTELPGGFVIEERKIRGVVSRGMICSEVELGLGDDASGIMVLDPNLQVGKPLRDLYGPEDWSLELEITINRPDCLSHIGVAREIAAALNLPFSPPEHKVAETGPSIAELTSIKIFDPELCPRYSARLIQGVKIGPSPDWLRWRLEAAGLRAINNVVDVTNFVMLEMGHPMHAFDFHMLAEGRIEVRCAAHDESFTTLDEVERRLDEKMLLICDGQRGVALAGVMGGLNSEITENTTDLLLESAYFDPVNTRRTSRLLNLTTDSSRRFERGADPNATVRALDMAASLIKELAGGDIARGVADEYPRRIDPWTVELRPQRVTTMLGVEVAGPEIKKHLEHLACAVEGSDPFTVTIPTHRPDLEREIDLIEEIARLHGYNQIPTADRARVSMVLPDTTEETFYNRLVSTLVKLGFSQIKTSPLVSCREASLAGYDPPVKLRNPGSEDMAYLRNGLLPGLLRVAGHNVNRGMPNLRIFEMGRVFAQGDKAEREWDMVGGVIIGIHEPRRWDQPQTPVGFLDIKGIMESFLAELSLDKAIEIYYNTEKPEIFTADVVSVTSDEVQIGWFGQLHPDVAADFDLDVPVFAFELNVAPLVKGTIRRQNYKPFPKYPALQRDLAFVVREEITAGEIEQAIVNAGGENLDSCDLFDVYRGQPISAAHKSMAFRLSFQSLERTLTDDEADEVIKQIITSVETRFAAKLRA